MDVKEVEAYRQRLLTFQVGRIIHAQIATLQPVDQSRQWICKKGTKWFSSGKGELFQINVREAETKQASDQIEPTCN
jgi:hypothetical protein